MPASTPPPVLDCDVVVVGAGPGGATAAAWLARAARLGEEVVARTMQGETRGLFETVDEEGQLVLKAAGGRVAIPAADVFFERGA